MSRALAAAAALGGVDAPGRAPLLRSGKGGGSISIEKWGDRMLARRAAP